MIQQKWHDNVDDYEQRCMQEINISTRGEFKTSSNVPCAALLFSRTTGQILATSHNKKHTTNNIFDHCELLLLKKWSYKTKSWRFGKDVGVYCLLEPCYMCYFSLIEARLTLIVYCLANPRTRTIENVQQIEYARIKKTQVIHCPPNSPKYQNLLHNFFKTIRTKKLS